MLSPQIDNTIYDTKNDVQEQFKVVPHELKVLPNWVCFTFEADPDGGKPRKVPYQLNGHKASHSDPATWNTYPNCVAAVERGDFDTIGFAFTNTPYMGFDYDNCLDPDTGILLPAAQDIIDRLESYTEESVSGTGIHILMKGKLPEGRRKSSPLLPDIEMYDTARFFVVTGEQWAGSPTTIESRTSELAEIHCQLFPPEPKREPAAPTNPNTLKDDDIITRASSSNKKFLPLWTGNWQSLGFPSQSEADLSLCTILAFWTGNDDARIDTLFRQSALYRKKWETAYYRNKTIGRAIEGTQTTYSASYGSSPAPEKAPTAPGAPGAAKSRIDKVFEMLTNTRLSTMTITPIEYLDSPYIIKNGVNAFTGEASHGKSTFVLSRLHEVANNKPDTMVIYCDADNPAGIALERSERLRGTLDDKISYWGGFLTDDDGTLVSPWDIGNPNWLALIKKITDTGKHPIIVFDTLNSFMDGGNENDNAVVGKIMNYMRMMTNYKATVIIIHHTGKSATSKESRGASSFKGGVDAGWLIDSYMIDSEIKTMTLSAWKSRLGKTVKHTYKMMDGKLVAVEADNTQMILNFVLTHKGKTKSAIEKAANGKFSRQAIRDAITKCIVAKKLRIYNDKVYACGDTREEFELKVPEPTE